MTDTPVGSPLVWTLTIVVVLALFVVDFLITRRPHEVSMREAIGWSAFYIAIPLGFGVWVWTSYGAQRGLEYYTGYLVEKSLSVDNLFIFILILSSFAVPRVLQQRALLFGIIGQRWENHPLRNDHWVRPGDNERPENAAVVEGACYW